MKKIVLAFISLLFLVSCGEKDKCNNKGGIYDEQKKQCDYTFLEIEENNIKEIIGISNAKSNVSINGKYLENGNINIEFSGNANLLSQIRNDQIVFIPKNKFKSLGYLGKVISISNNVIELEQINFLELHKALKDEPICKNNCDLINEGKSISKFSSKIGEYKNNKENLNYNILNTPFGTYKVEKENCINYNSHLTLPDGTLAKPDYILKQIKEIQNKKTYKKINANKLIKEFQNNKKKADDEYEKDTFDQKYLEISGKVLNIGHDGFGDYIALGNDKSKLYVQCSILSDLKVNKCELDKINNIKKDDTIIVKGQYFYSDSQKIKFNNCILLEKK